MSAEDFEFEFTEEAVIEMLRETKKQKIGMTQCAKYYHYGK